ncbi:Putative component of type VI protein secretion system [Hyphomicrobiales bacterium]|nr:putative component of type VI protein secretion system [Hyphomicrobiales bacterium]CAH1676103.1 Putative component of type VI protein secretion system [Hyphomicrobiales bacterium]
MNSGPMNSSAMNSWRQIGTAERFTASLGERLAIDGVVHVDFMRLRDRLRSDIETVLNTRQPAVPLPPALPELQRSLLSFGLAGPSGSGLDGPGHEGFHRTIEQGLAAILPQLMSVRVEAVAEDYSGNSCIHLRISAAIGLAQGSQSLMFDTRYIIDTGRFTVESAGE